MTNLAGQGNALLSGLSNLSRYQTNLPYLSNLVGLGSNAAMLTNLSSMATNLGALTNLARLVTNGQASLSNLYAIQTNLGGIGSNAAGIRSDLWALGTNLNGISSNLAGMGTNLESIASNSALVGGIYSSWTSALAGMHTNFNGEVTNDDALASLTASNFLNAPGMSNMLVYGSGLEVVMSGLTGKKGGEAPPGDWGVLRIPKLLDDDFYEWDLKAVIRLDPLEEKIQFRVWLRTIIMWLAVVLSIEWLVHELRLGLWHALTPPPTPSNALVAAAAAAPLGPAGIFVSGTAMWTIKAFSLVTLIGFLLMLPAICVASAATTLTIVGSNNPMYMAVTGAALVDTTPSVIWRIVWLFGPWFPLIELCFIGMNLLAARMGLDGTVSFLMVYCKSREK